MNVSARYNEISMYAAKQSIWDIAASCKYTILYFVVRHLMYCERLLVA